MAAESTSFLFRSFSAPSETSTATQEGDSKRVLGESISFGRFLSESLNWERWSSFTSNRYVEEAEKYSKPGSVAAKKAYFEAHYKRKAAEKQAVLAQEANEASGTFNSETLESNCNDSSDVAESSADAIVTSDEQPDKEADDCQVVIDCTSRNNLDAGQSDSGISNVHGEGDGYTHVITNLNVESCVITDDSNQHDQIEIHQNIALPGEAKKSDHGVADPQVLPLPTEGTEVNSSPELSAKTCTPQQLSHTLNERKAAEALPPRSGIKKKSISILTENRRQTSQSLHMSINLSSGNGETSKTDTQSRNGVNSALKSKKAVEVSIEKKRLTGPSGANKTSMTATATAAVKPRPVNHTLKGMKPGEGSVEKRPTSSSLRRSLNLPSSTGKATEMTSVFDKRIERNHCSLRNIPKVRSLASNISTKVSHDFSNQDSENPPYPGRRTEEVLKSVSRGVAANVKLPSASSECMKSSSSNKIIPRPPTMSSPFTFRSEERAVKRKEFLERVYGIKNKEVEKIQFQRTPENNIKHDFKLGQSSGSKPKLNQDGHGASCSPSNQIQKTSVTHKSFGNSWKPPISTNNSNRATEKLNRSTRHSVTSMTKITRENASPNIQH
ncbi:protein WVD2-like 7 isoform X2 [Arachis duranensis]|uniref:Protein WVD2-like 7 isoform X2 n=1 Tax=Arachis duranensis TaxID=130453 RepID=A0A6P5MU18_ARADU|nr:protein WVD2-like 7 isoform X2 [Arachis duranensis]